MAGNGFKLRYIRHTGSVFKDDLDLSPLIFYLITYVMLCVH